MAESGEVDVIPVGGAVFPPLVRTRFQGSAANRSGDALKRAPIGGNVNTLVPWEGSRQGGQHIPPFPLAFGETAKGLRHRVPASESFCEGKRVIFSGKAIGPG